MAYTKTYEIPAGTLKIELVDVDDSMFRTVRRYAVSLNGERIGSLDKYEDGEIKAYRVGGARTRGWHKSLKKAACWLL